MNTEQKLREEWGKTSNSCKFPISVGEWWLSKRKEELEELLGQIEGMKKECEQCENREVHENEYNSALSVVSSLIKSLMK